VFILIFKNFFKYRLTLITGQVIVLLNKQSITNLLIYIYIYVCVCVLCMMYHDSRNLIFTYLLILKTFSKLIFIMTILLKLVRKKLLGLLVSKFKRGGVN